MVQGNGSRCAGRVHDGSVEIGGDAGGVESQACPCGQVGVRQVSHDGNIGESGSVGIDLHRRWCLTSVNEDDISSGSGELKPGKRAEQRGTIKVDRGSSEIESVPFPHNPGGRQSPICHDGGVPAKIENPTPDLDRNFPFSLKENECVISFKNGEITGYFKIENITEKKAVPYPSPPPNKQ